MHFPLLIVQIECFASILPKLSTGITSVQAGAVLMPLAMFLLSFKSIRVLSIMNFILKLAYIYIKSLRRYKIKCDPP